MQELLDFVESKIVDGSFIGLNKSNESDGAAYTVDYWELEALTNSMGEEVEIKAGKQKIFTL